MNRKLAFFGISLVSLSVLVLELSLTRLFSATMYYHFAFMAISLALFGSGASGVFVYIFQSRLGRISTSTALAVSSSLFGLSTLGALAVILMNPLTFETGMANQYRLIAIYLACGLPFFFGGSAVTLAISRFASEISRLYLFDLAGAAAGCLLLIPVLNWIGAINTVLLVAALASAAAVLFSFEAKTSGFQRIACGIIALSLLGLLCFNLITDSIEVRTAKGYTEKNVVFSKWNSFSRITVEGTEDIGYEIKIDSDAATKIVPKSNDVQSHAYQLSRIEALAYHVKPAAKALIIGPGGGFDVMGARVFGVGSITAVEVNPIIARDVMSGDRFVKFSEGVYQHPEVRLVVDEGRSFIRSSAARYDLIQATMVDTWAATAAGAFALTENNLYTVEAFDDYVRHLEDDGVLTMTRWYFEPPDQLLRLISLTRAMMSDLGIRNPERHIMLVRDARWKDERSPATFIFKKSELTGEEIHAVEKTAATVGFELLYTPLTRPDNLFTKMIIAPNAADVWGPFATNIEPVRDNNPFFFNSLRLSNLGLALGGTGEWQKTNLGTLVLFSLFGVTSVLVVVFILGPLLFRRKALATGTKTKLGYLLYFACLGTGFIIVEVAMVQKFILFLGHPVYALAVVLFSILTFSAVGSSITGRFNSERLTKTLTKLLLVLVGIVAVYIIALPPVFYGLVHLALWLRIIIAVFLIAPLALAMGMPMPTGIRILSEQASEIIPWAWGVNGAASVMGTVAALVIAILSGFNQALAAGSGLYLIAIVCVRLSAKTGEEAGNHKEGRLDVKEAVVVSDAV